MKKCPKCGKLMVQLDEWPGLWICTDYQHAINFAPPFKYKCHGIIAEKFAVDSFTDEVMKQIASRN